MPETQTPSRQLATFLLGGGHVARVDWTNAIRLALAWRVIPQFREAIANANVELPSEARQLLGTLSAAAAAQSGAICARAGAAVEALNRGGVKAALFKGAGNVATIYKAPARRMLNDADVLIRESDFSAASTILAEAGFKAAIDIPLDEWMSLLEDRVYRAHDFLDFVDDSGTRIDLHWQLRTRTAGGFTVESILSRSTPAKLGAHDVIGVCAVDSILLTIHHITRERFAPSSAVKDLLDVQCWFNSGVAFDDLVQRAREASLTVSLIAVARILGSMDRLVSTVSAQEINAGQRLASIFHMQLDGVKVSDIGIGLAAVSPSLIGRYLISRMRSFRNSTYRRHKFAEENPRTALSEMRAFLLDLMSYSPGKVAAYRALARETAR